MKEGPCEERVAIHKPGREFLPETEPYWSRFLGISSFQKCKKINFCCLNNPAYGILLLQPKWTTVILFIFPAGLWSSITSYISSLNLESHRLYVCLPFILSFLPSSLSALSLSLLSLFLSFPKWLFRLSFKEKNQHFLPMSSFYNIFMLKYSCCT